MILSSEWALIVTALGIFIGTLGYIQYFRGMFTGRTKPHAFTWLIWGILLSVAFAAQLSDNGGAGSWVTGYSGFVCLLIGLLAFRFGEKEVTKGDWFTFFSGLAAIPLWFLTSEPLTALMLIILIDIFGFYPTFRKSWIRPHEENLFHFSISIAKYAFGLLALSSFTWTTVLYPAWSLFSTAILTLIILDRRRRYLNIMAQRHEVHS